jgi:hypothetical protein
MTAIAVVRRFPGIGMGSAPFFQVCAGQRQKFALLQPGRELHLISLNTTFKKLKLDLASLTDAFNVRGASVTFVSVERMGDLVKQDHLNSQR